tara:strand:+ start:210 stop:344 length:135 start_codon:yes stop_codon:yes gene_type:complete
MENNKKDSVVLGFVVFTSIILIVGLGIFQLIQSIVSIVRWGFGI